MLSDVGRIFSNQMAWGIEIREDLRRRNKSGGRERWEKNQEHWQLSAAGGMGEAWWSLERNNNCKWTWYYLSSSVHLILLLFRSLWLVNWIMFRSKLVRCWPVFRAKQSILQFHGLTREPCNTEKIYSYINHIVILQISYHISTQ